MTYRYIELDVISSQIPSSAGLTPNALPEVQGNSNRKNSDTGVSPRNAQWFVLKTTYGQERKACDYLNTKGIKTFYPTITKMKEMRGKRRAVTESRLPNLFFAYGTEEQLTPLVQRNPLIPFLSYYCRYFNESGRRRRQIITIPEKQMDSLIKICKAEEQGTLFYTEAIHKFEKGAWVRVVEGPFSGVMGKVARFKGQQRVGVVIDGLLTAVTAYVPSAFIEETGNNG